MPLTHQLRTAKDLVTAGLIAPGREGEAARIGETYAIAVTPEIAALIDRNDPNDPIARQFVPDIRELNRLPEEHEDPIGDAAHSPVKGIVHRYPDRVLLKITGVCPVYCRFCFRREMVGPKAEANLTHDELEKALAYIAAHPEIWEVILTGGDPLILSPRRISEIMGQLGEIDHVKVVRWHTRVPIASPRLITDELVFALMETRQSVYIVVHVNHPRELSEATRGALSALADHGIPLLSQSVLLKGINDDVATLEALFRALVEERVTPYHLHHGDLAPGTAHFRTNIAEGQALMRELRQRLSGIALPTYVVDIPGGFGKVPAGPTYLTETTLIDPKGEAHAYPARSG